VNWGRQCLGNWEGREFARHRLANWRNAFRISQVKLPHIPEITNRKAVAELAGKPRGQLIQKLSAILRTVRALLFLLDDAPANLIVCVDLQQVDAPCGTLASRQYQAADAVIKRIGILAFIHGNPQMSGKILALLASSVESLLLVDYA
jgi:hypothetical protein